MHSAPSAVGTRSRSVRRAGFGAAAAFALAAACLGGCPSEVELPACGPTGLPTLGADLLDPWPNSHLVVEAADGDADGGTGCRLAIPPAAVPVGPESTRFPAERLAWRDGFSPAGTIVWRPGVSIDGSLLPPVGNPGACLAPDSPVQLWDLQAAIRIPCFAELDAWPEQPDEERALLIRPMVHMGFDRQIGVVITTAMGIAPPAAWTGYADDADPVVAAWYDGLLQRLEGLGTAREDVVFAWDFPTASAASIRAPLDQVVAAVRADLPDGGAGPAVTVSSFADADAGDAVPPGVWREVRGSVRWSHFLWAESGADDAPEDEHDEGFFRLDEATGLPVERGDGDVFFTLIVPETARFSDPGTVPVVVFGHGIFSSPQHYLASATDEESTIDLCSRMAAICVGTEWRGLTTRDVADSLRVARDLGRFPLLTDKLVQGVANTVGLARLLRTSFMEEAFLAWEGGSLVDAERIHYFGISLGWIEGAVCLAKSEVVEYGVLHVPGSMWATMLERSSNWTDFESFVTDTQPDPALRQVMYALSQLLWDPVDPIHYTEALEAKSALWQVSVGDEQVPNFTAEALGRTRGLELVGEPVTSPWRMVVVDAPQGPGASGMTQFDSGYPAPPDVNRPAEDTGAHKAIRHTEPMKVQTAQFFVDGAEGTIVHPCDGPCVFEPEE